jgi:hypothetical protein
MVYLEYKKDKDKFHEFRYLNATQILLAWNCVSYGYDRQHNNKAEISSGEDKNKCWYAYYLFNISIDFLRYMFRPTI